MIIQTRPPTDEKNFQSTWLQAESSWFSYQSYPANHRHPLTSSLFGLIRDPPIADFLLINQLDFLSKIEVNHT